MARPDLPHPRIVLAGSPGGDIGEDAGLIPALRTRGLHARWMSWPDPDLLLRAELVILRAVTDYRDRLDEFLVWTRRVPNLLNPPDIVAWNAGQSHMRDLDRAGVPVLSGQGLPGGTDQTALVFLGGEQSHAFTTKSAVEPDFELWDVAQTALQTAVQHAGIRRSDVLFARADVTDEPSDPRLVSLDLIAPSLGWLYLDADARALAQRRFALCVESALDRLGLGPLSHRRP